MIDGKRVALCAELTATTALTVPLLMVEGADVGSRPEAVKALREWSRGQQEHREKLIRSAERLVARRAQIEVECATIETELARVVAALEEVGIGVELAARLVGVEPGALTISAPSRGRNRSSAS